MPPEGGVPPPPSPDWRGVSVGRADVSVVRRERRRGMVDGDIVVV